MKTDITAIDAIADRLNTAIIKAAGPARAHHRYAQRVSRRDGAQKVAVLYSDGHEETFDPADAIRAAEYFEGGGRVLLSLHGLWATEQKAS